VQLSRRALIGIIVVVLGITAVPAASYSASAGSHHVQYRGKSSKARTKKHKTAKRCKKGDVKRSGKCVKETTAPASTAPTRTPSTEASIPAQVRTGLLQTALLYAEDHGYSFLREVEAVATTIGEAGHASAYPTLDGQTAVYVVAMRFASICTAPHGETCGPQKTVLELEYLARGLEGLRAETVASYPDLSSLGVPIELQAPEAP
jgi:hypothetical protein